MKSKAVVFACLLFLSALVIASAVSEGNQEQHEKVKAEVGDENPVEESKQYGCHHGCCRYYGSRCVKCCGSAAEAQAMTHAAGKAGEEGEVEASGYGGGGGHGGWGGGGHRGGGGGHRGGGGGRGGGGK